MFDNIIKTYTFTFKHFQISCCEPEVIGMQLCSKTQLQSQGGMQSTRGTEPMTDLAQVSEACSKLSSMLEQVLAYVDDVLAGKQPPDNQVNICLFINIKSQIK